MKSVRLNTGIWYNDHAIDLSFPDSWDIVACWPDLPAPLSLEELRQQLKAPVNSLPPAQLVKGARRPVIVIDDLARPTPVHKILPLVLDEFAASGIEAEDVRIVVATGTHGRQDARGLARKIGEEAYRRCRIIIHNYKKDIRYIGKTSFNTPVYVNKEVLAGDCLIGIGGIYPQHTTGFGGGSKLALGVLGRKSIVHLHFGGHGSVGGTYNIDNSFRDDLDEIASMIGFDTMITVHINAASEIVRLVSGDHFIYYREAAAFSREAYDAPLPSDADAVIVNTYPSDVSYTFMRKGMKPLRCAPSQATKVAIGYNHEGIGEHGIFPQGGNSRLEGLRALRLRISTMDKRLVLRKIFKQLRGGKNDVSQVPEKAEQVVLAEKVDNLILYRPKGGQVPLPPMDGMDVKESWEEVVAAIGAAHPGREKLRVYLYPCASLQCLDHLQLRRKTVGEHEGITTEN